jgi:hypothetical protein
MWRRFAALSGIGVCSAACSDQLVEAVPIGVCYSQQRWIGGKRGSPEMYPGRDCVGCHLDNDGPELVFGGTLYAYLEIDPNALAELQTGEDCFGVAGQTIRITGGDGQVFEVVTNAAGNFYAEGSATSLVKPYTAAVVWTARDDTPQNSPMADYVLPAYGGCARCHTPGREVYPPRDAPDDLEVNAADRVRPTTRIGLPGNFDLREEVTGEPSE